MIVCRSRSDLLLDFASVATYANYFVKLLKESIYIKCTFYSIFALVNLII